MVQFRISYTHQSFLHNYHNFMFSCATDKKPQPLVATKNLPSHRLPIVFPFHPAVAQTNQRESLIIHLLSRYCLQQPIQRL